MSPRSTRPPAYHPGRRVAVMTLALVLVAGGLVAQLVRIQFLEPERYVAWGDQQWQRTIEVPGERGELLDRNGERLAVSMPNPTIAVQPASVVDPVTQAAALAPVLGRPAEELEELLSADGYRFLQRPSDEATAEAVRTLGLAGVLIEEEPARFLPNGTLARGVIGLTDIDGAGISGLEAQLDDELSGEPGMMARDTGDDGRTIPDSERVIDPAEQGSDITLTIDRALQFQVEQSLMATVEEHQAAGGVVIITQPATGDILAMASVGRTDDGEIVTTSENKAVTWTYEPASVMKALTFSAVLDQGIASPSTRRRIPDTIDLYEETFTDDELYGTQRMTPTEILVRSSNTGTVTWAMELGQERLHDYLGEFGLGRPTGLDFPGESQGLFPDVEDWSGTEIASISLGQGISVTPLQMLAAYNAIANGGLYVSPRLVASIDDGDGPRRLDGAPARRVIHEETASSIRDMLTRVVVDGTAHRAAVPGYDIAAKTGTAQKPQEGGGYTDELGQYHYVATVAGFFPSDHPEFSMIVVIDEPTPEFYASRVSAPLFGELAAWTLRHFQVSPGTDLVFDDAGGTPDVPVDAPAPDAEDELAIVLDDEVED